MSKFYNSYKKNHPYVYNKFIARQEAANDIHKQHINQFKNINTGKHPGSKSAYKMINTINADKRNANSSGFKSLFKNLFKRK